MSQLAENTAARIRKEVSCFQKMGRFFGFPQSEKLLLVHGYHEQFSHKSLDNISSKAPVVSSLGLFFFSPEYPQLK